MNHPMLQPVRRRMSVAVVLLVLSGSFLSAQKKPLTFTDIMKFRQLESPVISEDGNWVAYGAQPDRGDGEVEVHSLQSRTVYTIPRGTKPAFSRDAHWVAMSVKPTAVDLEKADDAKDKPKSGMVLLNTATGDTLHVQAVESFSFSNDSHWLAYQKSPGKRTSVPGETPAAEDTSLGLKAKKKEDTGSDLILRELQSGKETQIAFVTTYAFDSTSHFLACAVADTIGGTNGVYVCDLQAGGLQQQPLLVRRNGTFTNLTWYNAIIRLAFVAAALDDKEKPGPASVWLWSPGEDAPSEVIGSGTAPAGWILPSKNELVWSRDGKSLFFGFRPLNASDSKPDEMKDSTVDVFDTGALLKKRGVDVWSWNDPRIIPNQKKRWKDVKDQTYRAVYHTDRRNAIILSDLELPVVEAPQNSQVALGRSNVPYLEALTWEGEFSDVYLVDLTDGARTRIVSHLNGPAVLSPSGKYVLYYRDRHWFLYSRASATTRNLTDSIKAGFFDDEHDTPDPPPAYGFGGWTEGDRAVLLYDKYDVWQVATDTVGAYNLTEGAGRKNDLTFRIEQFDPDAKFFRDGETVLLSAYHNHKKFTAFYAAVVGRRGVEKLVEEARRYTFLARAKRAERMIFTRQSYTEFPDLWVSDLRLRKLQRVSELNPQIGDFAWGSAELVEWNSLDGIPLQGVLIKPGNFDPGKRYPVLVYFYELSSQRLYEFNQVVVSHRPCFPFYASNGYAVFLPDVRFEIGRPGFSATKCIVPGVQKLIDMGVADTGAIALHGHSWSGYETAFMVTQTNLFACAIAGAAVANMTSAYSGIRLESGLARQFQYEQEQSRIGGSLWEYRDRYIENSPVFFADRIKTPLLLECGDEDEAVPWAQNVEMYLAMRRLNKPCWLLEYRGEGHHLKKYPNKLDYSIRFKEFLDYYLKHAPVPEWIAKGVPYSE